MSGLSHELWTYGCRDGGQRVCLAVYRRMSGSLAAWINEALATMQSRVHVEHVGHGRYDLVSPVDRQRIGIRLVVSVRSG